MDRIHCPHDDLLHKTSTTKTIPGTHIPLPRKMPILNYVMKDMSNCQAKASLLSALWKVILEKFAYACGAERQGDKEKLAV